MMKTRLMVGAFLVYQSKILLMRRGLHKRIAPGMWSCVGGHMEPVEINNPVTTCYREIMEETGIAKDSIQNLRLRYITMRYVDDEIRTVYYFFGETKNECKLPVCDEGALHWIDIEELAEKEMSFSVKEITNHWLSHKNDDKIYLCGSSRENNRLTWAALS